MKTGTLSEGLFTGGDYKNRVQNETPLGFGSEIRNLFTMVDLRLNPPYVI